jgi:hypothetical protein
MEWLEAVILSTLVLTFHRTLANVNVVAFDPSARSSHPDNSTVKVCDWENGELEWSKQGYRRRICACRFDSRRRIGEYVFPCSLSAHRRFAYRLSLSRDLRSATVSGFHDPFIKLGMGMWSVNARTSLPLRTEHSASTVRFLPGGDSLVNASHN